jgi:hypothetical protein
MRFTQHKTTLPTHSGYDSFRNSHEVTEINKMGNVYDEFVQAAATRIAHLNVDKAQAYGGAARADGEAREMRSPRSLSTPRALARS